jgi:tRNA (cmo5U34)-methyltransferase
MNEDHIFASPRDRIARFRFDANVADVFENMINRSVPGYALILDLIGMVTGKYGIAGTRCYDLGCSLGASTLMIRRHLPAGCHVIGIDNSKAMVDRCRANITRDHSIATVEIREESLLDTRIENASLVVLNFTLQFVSPDLRSTVLDNIWAGLNPGGALLLSEKVCFTDPNEQSAMTELHEAFKRDHGYSDLEIAQKRIALENVLVPSTMGTHLDELKRAGFSHPYLLARCLNFCSFIAVKGS